MNGWIIHSFDQSINQPFDQSINQSFNHSINQSIDHDKVKRAITCAAKIGPSMEFFVKKDGINLQYQCHGTHRSDYFRRSPFWPHNRRSGGPPWWDEAEASGWSSRLPLSPRQPSKKRKRVESAARRKVPSGAIHGQLTATQFIYRSNSHPPGHQQTSYDDDGKVGSLPLKWRKSCEQQSLFYNQSINQSIEQSINQSINQSIEKPINQSTNQSTGRSIEIAKCGRRKSRWKNYFPTSRGIFFCIDFVGGKSNPSFHFQYKIECIFGTQNRPCLKFIDGRRKKDSFHMQNVDKLWSKSPQHTVQRSRTCHPNGHADKSPRKKNREKLTNEKSGDRCVVN